jgi:hypothetical protein
MSFDIVYDWPARAVLLDRTHWRVGGEIDAAVIRFAATRAATIERAPAYHLRAAGHSIVLAVDRDARVVTVLRIYRAR